MPYEHGHTFDTINANVGKFHLGGKTVLVPQMNRIAAHLFTATLRSFGLRAKTLETYRGVDLAKAHTSGKECYPCLVTMGDILYFVDQERKRLGDKFNADDFIYFLPGAEGPCRFGMYTKYQRLVLDSFLGTGQLRIGAITSGDGYSLEGLLDESRQLDLRKASYFALVVADVMDRLLWRLRPYEKEPGMMDAFIQKAMEHMEDIFETHSANKEFGTILDRLEETIKTGKTLIDPALPRKPLIGVVGEVFIRMHPPSNENLIRTLEGFGAEVVNASLTEWVNFVSYVNYKHARGRFRRNLKQWRIAAAKSCLRETIGYGLDYLYQEFRKNQVYKRVTSIINLIEDHDMAHLDRVLAKADLFTFDLKTEPGVCIASILEYIHKGLNGVVNVYPFTCMHSMTVSAIIKPIMNKQRIPYLDISCDGTAQPGREAAIRTFLYQVYQHFRRNGGKEGTEDAIEPQ
jgi:predicted nucleotide-binding protein (sugar kinase/HSP70/actin superfamily)